MSGENGLQINWEALGSSAKAAPAQVETPVEREEPSGNTTSCYVCNKPFVQYEHIVGKLKRRNYILRIHASCWRVWIA